MTKNKDIKQHNLIEIQPSPDKVSEITLDQLAVLCYRQFASLDDRLEQIEKQIEKKFDLVDQRSILTEERLDGLQKGFYMVNTNFNVMNRKLDNISEKLSAKIESRVSRVDKHEFRISDLEAKIN